MIFVWRKVEQNTEKGTMSEDAQKMFIFGHFLFYLIHKTLIISYL